MPSIIRSVSHTGAYSTAAVTQIARNLRSAVGRPSQLAMAYVSPDYLPHIEEFCDLLRVEGWVVDVAGCAGAGWVTVGQEQEGISGFSVLALSNPQTTFTIHKVEHEEDVGPDFPALIALLDPTAMSSEEWLEGFHRARPQTLLLGGLAAGSEKAAGAGAALVFHNGQAVEHGLLVGWRGGSLRLVGMVSQGCRPIGEPLTVTRAENNVVYALGAQPAYQALESAFQTLTDQEKSTARGNLLAGLATSEYVEDFQAGDFLVRSIIGADPNSGAVVIGGIPRIGQTLQYQYRDRAAASSDLMRQLRQAVNSLPPVLGAVLFSCVGRGKAFFGSPHHDALCLAGVCGNLPVAGFLGQGEIGPVHGINCLTAYSAAAGLFYDDEESI